MPKETIYLIDGTSICYRSFFAIKLSNSRGFPTGAAFGFYQTVKKIISKYNPQYLGVCFDVSKKTFRHEKFKEYKIQRPPLPDGLKQQIPLIKKLIDFLGITLIEKEGFEADDIIATLAHKATKDNHPAVIVSSDKDVYQLIKDREVEVYNPVQEKIWEEKDFIKEYGFVPPLIVDFLSLAGDSSDNVPGAKGIGKVGASKLIKNFGTIENIFNNLDKVEDKTRKCLEESKESILLSKELVELSAFNLNVSLEDLKLKEPKNLEIRRLFEELEFKALVKDLPAPCLDVKIKIKEGLPQNILDKNEPLIFFIESDLVYFLINNCIYKEQIDKAKDIILDEGIKKISYGLKNQLISLKSIAALGIWFDIKIAAYLIDSALLDYSLTTLISHYLGEVVSEVPSQLAPYFIGRLYPRVYQKLKEEGLDRLFFEVEMPLVPVLAQMQRYGIKIDLKVMTELLGEVEKKIENASTQIFKAADKNFNLNSPKQLQVVLFKDLKIPPIKKTKTGYSTNEEVLEKLAPQYKIAELLLEYRQLNKLKTTYILPLIEAVKARKGRLFAQFNQTQTATGRLSSSSPNLQSIPVRGEFSSYLRKAFVSTFTDGFILAADYSQIELRILAHFSKDNCLIEAFQKNRDIHRYTASLVFGIDEAKVDQKMRDLAKRVNFGIIYGMNAFGLARELGVPTEEAESFINRYFLRYKKVKDYINRIHQEAETKGYTQTIMGRRRNLPDLKSANPQLRDFAHRQATNAPIQGSCADIIKIAMVKIDEELKKKNLKARLIIQIHDELLFDLPYDEKEVVSELVKRNMQDCVKLDVPIEVNLKIGRNWGEMHEM